LFGYPFLHATKMSCFRALSGRTYNLLPSAASQASWFLRDSHWNGWLARFLTTFVQRRSANVVVAAWLKTVEIVVPHSNYSFYRDSIFRWEHHYFSIYCGVETLKNSRVSSCFLFVKNLRLYNFCRTLRNIGRSFHLLSECSCNKTVCI